MRGRGLGSLLMRAGADWVETQGAPYLTGFIGVNNVASMAMVTSLGWEPIARFDYLVLDLARFAPDPEVKIRKVDVLGDPAHAAWRFGEVFLHHFVPRYLVSDLFRPYPKGPYMGSLTAFGPGGSAWLSLWDDRARRGLDPVRIRAVKAYDVTLKGEGGFRAFSAIAATLSGMDLDHLLLPLPHDTTARALLEPFASDIVEFNFCVKRLNGAAAVPPAPSTSTSATERRPGAAAGLRACLGRVPLPGRLWYTWAPSMEASFVAPGPVDVGATLSRFHLWGEDPVNRLSDGVFRRAFKWGGRWRGYELRWSGDPDAARLTVSVPGARRAAVVDGAVADVRHVCGLHLDLASFRTPRQGIRSWAAWPRDFTASGPRWRRTRSRCW